MRVDVRVRIVRCARGTANKKNSVDPSSVAASHGRPHSRQLQGSIGCAWCCGAAKLTDASGSLQRWTALDGRRAVCCRHDDREVHVENAVRYRSVELSDDSPRCGRGIALLSHALHENPPCAAASASSAAAALSGTSNALPAELQGPAC